MSEPIALLAEFFAAENARDWLAYVQFLHPSVEWRLGDRVVRGRAEYVGVIKRAYACSQVTFRVHQVLESVDQAWVATLLVDSTGERSLDVFEFEDCMIRREWEFCLGRGSDWNGELVDFRLNV